MMQLTEAQQKTLEEISYDHLVAQLVTGALVVALEELYIDPSVIDVDGQLYPLSRYLAVEYRQN